MSTRRTRSTCRESTITSHYLSMTCDDTLDCNTCATARNAVQPIRERHGCGVRRYFISMSINLHTTVSSALSRPDDKCVADWRPCDRLCSSTARLDACPEHALSLDGRVCEAGV